MLPHNKIYLSRAQTKSMSAYEPIGDPTGGAAYGEFNDPVTAVVSAGANLLGASMGADAAENAADTQAAASNYSAGLQKQMFDTQNAQQAPYREAGYSALSDISSLKPYLTNQYNTKFGAKEFAEGIDPGYAFRLKMGQDQAMRQANLGGGAISGNALTGLQDYTQGQASQEFGNAYNRFNTDFNRQQTQRGNIYNTLASIAGLGQTSLGQTGQASTQAGANIGQAISNAGSAQAAGTVGSANALAGGLTGAANSYMLSNLLKPQVTTPVNTSGFTGSDIGNVSYALKT